MAKSSVEIMNDLSPSLSARSNDWLAWQLEAEDKRYHQLTPLSVPPTFLSLEDSRCPLYQFQNVQGNTVSFNLKPPSTDGDCFFDAVDRADFIRDILVKKLLDNPTESICTVFAHEIRRFLYLGYTGSYPHKQEGEACQQLLTIEAKKLFFVFQKTEAAFRPIVDEARSELGVREAQQHPSELLDLLKQRNAHLAKKFEQSYQAILDADKAIYEYCCQIEVFKNYVTLYLEEERGYIPFSCDFGKEISTTTIDVINQLFELKIQVYLPGKQGEAQFQLANQLQVGEVIPIFHNGINHFWGLISNPANVCEDLKKTENDLNPTYQSSTVSGDVIIYLSPLPGIPYNREELNEIIEEIPMGSDIQIRVSDYLENIEKQVLAIQNYQAKKKPENFYDPMRSSINEIRNTAKTLYELTKHYHSSLANTLKELLLKWIIPLEIELDKRLEMSTDDRSALIFKTKHLYAEQSVMSRKPLLQQALMEYLNKIKMLLLEPSRPSPRCYISYAWPSKGNKEQEYWVQPFLSVLYDHLTATGIRVVMDIRDNKPAESIYQFMQQYHESNYIILVGTESLLQKHYAVIPHAVQTELSIVSSRSEKDQRQFGQSRIYPMLISGTLKTAYPERYQLYSTVRDAREQGYLGTLKKLTDWVYEHRINAVQLEHAKLWRTFNEAYSGLSKEPKSVEEEITVGYHRQRLDYLRQDLQYQSVEAQETTEHSQAVQAEQISVLMKSQGTNPQTLFNANGQQFQRPYSNPYFIERKVLLEKMTQHFAQSDQQILTLTAHGLGGMGKTELAQYYYQHPPKPYTLRAWFYAESKERIYLQYIELATNNGIQFLESMPIEDKVRRAKAWLESQKDYLLVYDNVPALNVVEGLLPQRGKHHILMTSRNSVGFPKHQTLDVDVMEKGEAMALMIKITDFQESETLRQLVSNTLGCLPLAVAQAGAYLTEKQTSVEDYLRLYQKHQAIILKDNTLERNPKHEPVWVTFDMNFKALEIDCPAALNTLKQASWLSSAVIPEVLLQSMINQDSNVPSELLWPDIKRYIGRYSLMKVDVIGHQLSIHPLLQDIIRSKQTLEEQLKQIGKCSKVLNALQKLYYQLDLITYTTLLSHAEHLHEHAKVMAINIKDSKTRDLLLIEPICLDMFYLHFGLTQQALIFLTQVILIHERHYGKDYVETVRFLGNLGTIYLQQGKYKEASECYDRALRIQEHHYGKGYVETTTELGGLGSIYLRQGKFKQAEECFKRALRIKEHHYGKENVETAAELGNLGNVYLQQGKLKEAEEHFKLALSIQEYHYAKEHIEIAVELAGLGNIYLQQDKLGEAQEHYEHALRIQEHHYGKEHVKTMASLGNLANVYFKQGKLKQAKDYYERALNIRERHYGKDHIETLVELSGLGKLYLEQGKPKQAEEYAEQSLRILQGHYGEDHKETAKGLTDLGNVCFKQGKFLQAIKYYESALKIQEHHYGKNHVKTADALGNLGIVYRELGSFKQAEEYGKRALRIQENYYGKDHVKTAEVLGNLGIVYRQLSNLKRAEEYGKRVLKIQESYYGKDHVKTAAVLVNLGNVYADQHKFKQAKNYYERALAIEERHYGKDYPEVANILFNLAMNNLKLNQPAAVRGQLQRVLTIYRQHFPEGHPTLTKIEKHLQLLPSVSFALAAEQKPASLTENIPTTTLKSDIYKFSKQGMKHYRAKEYKEAIKLFRQALNLQQQISNTPNEEIATLHFNMGSAYFFQKNYLSAKTALQSAYEMRLTLFGFLYAATQEAKSRLQECEDAIEQYATSSDEAALENKAEHFSSMKSTIRPVVFSTISAVSKEADVNSKKALTHKPRHRP